MITIQPSPTADTRTCDFTKVTLATLLTSSQQHISDVQSALDFFCDCIQYFSAIHDSDKLSHLGEFHANFVTGFEQTSWWDHHRRWTRHHLNSADGIPEDVNLLDVLEYIADCVMAGMARSGKVSTVELDRTVLSKAFENTVQLLKRNVTVAASWPL